MSAVRTISRKGFTLVEILIVVIILGILAAIVIPQFTSASEDARQNSLVSQVQTLRSQIELYKLQHTSNGTELFGGTVGDPEQWEELLSQTNEAGSTTIAPGEKAYGPYLQTMPVNGTTGLSGVALSTTADESVRTPVGVGAGFVYNTTTGKFFAVDVNGVITLDGKTYVAP